MPTARGTDSFDSFVTTNSGFINVFVEDYQGNYSSVRVHVRVDAIFSREVEEGRQKIPAFFLRRCTTSTVLSNPTYNLSPPTCLHKLTTGTFGVVALY